MTSIPPDLAYSEDHLWVERVLSSSNLRIGVTDFAQAALGEVVSVFLPDVDSNVTIGVPFGEIESAKVVNDLVSPVTGKVKAVNAIVCDEPTKINHDPYGDGWLLEIEPSATGQAAGLTAREYAALAGEA
jgi:glycine cleavage system H protein